MSDGKGCKCCASCYSECSCEDVDWTPQEVIDLRGEVAALAEQNAKMREALINGLAQVTILGGSPDPLDPYCDRIQVSVREELRLAIALPDLATPVINRIKAEGMREAAEEVIDLGDDSSTLDARTLTAVAKAIRAKANELEGEK